MAHNAVRLHEVKNALANRCCLGMLQPLVISPYSPHFLKEILIGWILFTRHYSKCFTNMNSVLITGLRGRCYYYSYFTWGNWGTRMLSNLLTGKQSNPPSPHSSAGTLTRESVFSTCCCPEVTRKNTRTGNSHLPLEWAKPAVLGPDNCRTLHGYNLSAGFYNPVEGF